MIYDYLKRAYKDLNEEKIIEYFKNKSMSDFKSNKKFWELYSSKIKIKSNKNLEQSTFQIKKNEQVITDKTEISEIFNAYFTSLSSESNNSLSECENFVDEQLKRACDDKQIKIQEGAFKFSFTTASEIEKLLSSIPTTSGPGVSGIPTKNIKTSPMNLNTVIAYLFNFSILTCTMPAEWKTAVVTPLYKNKGEPDDINNYRSLSVLPPIA